MNPFSSKPHIPHLGGLLCATVALLLAIAAIALPWMSVPTASDTLPTTLDVVITSEDAPITPIFKIQFAILFLATIWIIGSRPRKWQKRAAGLSCFALVILTFVYPYFVWQINSSFSARAQWLQSLHYHLTWLGGDIFTRQEETFEDDNQIVYIVDPPREAGVVKIPQSLPALFQIGQFSEIQGWLGYSSSFCQFVSKGWIFSCTSLVMLLIYLLKARGALDLKIVRYTLKVGVSTITFFTIAGTIPIIHTAYQMGKAHEGIQNGDYRQTLAHMERATWTMPIIREDSLFFVQQGIVARRAGLTTPQSDYYFANVLEADGFYLQAELLYRRILHENAWQDNVRRECIRAITRAAVYDLNTQQTELAERKLLEVLSWDPTDLKANYSLQMLWQRMRNTEGVATLSTTMRRIYQDFAAKNKAPVLQNSDRNLEFSRHNVPGEVTYE